MNSKKKQLFILRLDKDKMNRKECYNNLLELVDSHYKNDPKYEELKHKLDYLKDNVQSVKWEDEFEAMVGLTIIGPNRFRIFVNVAKQSYMYWVDQYLNLPKNS